MNSTLKNIKGINLMILSAIFTSLGQLFWKLSLCKLGIYLILGFTCYIMGAFLMIIAFRHGSFSVLHPLLSFSYVIAIFFGRFILNESLNVYKIFGIIFIIIGIVFIGVGDD